MKKTYLPGFTAEASCDRVPSFGAGRVNDRMLATRSVRPALTVIQGGGGGGFSCSLDDDTCVDCRDDIENIVCQECGQGGNIQCCKDDDNCDVYVRPTINCNDPLNGELCIECGASGAPGAGWICCTNPPCNVIPPGRTQPPTCFPVGGGRICISLPRPIGGPLPLR